jgi:hypothetical protein
VSNAFRHAVIGRKTLTEPASSAQCQSVNERIAGETNGSPDLEQLDRTACLELLATVSVGRVAWSDSDQILVFPLNFALDDLDVVFATSSRSILAEVASRGTLSFQADDYEPAIGTGWTVLVSGPANIVTEPEETNRLRQLVTPWRSADDLGLVRLRCERIAGRRLPEHPAVIESLYLDD